MAIRKQLSKKIRFEVFKRDSFTCQYCGATPPDIVLEIDHIDPIALGGSNSADNLITACFPCNRGKGAKSLGAIPMSLKDKAAMVKESEAQIQAYSSIMREKRERLERDCWEVAEKLSPGCAESGFNRKRLLSIKTFVNRLPLSDVLDSAEIASLTRKSEYKQFLYFCGICWRKIKEEGAA